MCRRIGTSHALVAALAVCACGGSTRPPSSASPGAKAEGDGSCTLGYEAADFGGRKACIKLKVSFMQSAIAVLQSQHSQLRLQTVDGAPTVRWEQRVLGGWQACDDCQVPAEQGAFCGGIVPITCPQGQRCLLDGDFPDAGGRCVAHTEVAWQQSRGCKSTFGWRVGSPDAMNLPTGRIYRAVLDAELAVDGEWIKGTIASNPLDPYSTCNNASHLRWTGDACTGVSEYMGDIEVHQDLPKACCASDIEQTCGRTATDFTRYVTQLQRWTLAAGIACPASGLKSCIDNPRSQLDPCCMAPATLRCSAGEAGFFAIPVARKYVVTPAGQGGDDTGEQPSMFENHLTTWKSFQCATFTECEPFVAQASGAEITVDVCE